MSDAEALGLPPHAFDRQDDGADLQFYAPPRLVTHIDGGAVAALSTFYRAAIPAGGRVLDLMSSWISHLPDDVDDDVVGHGMNTAESAANPRLSRWFVRDLNRCPALPEPDADQGCGAFRYSSPGKTRAGGMRRPCAIKGDPGRWRGHDDRAVRVRQPPRAVAPVQDAGGPAHPPRSLTVRAPPRRATGRWGRGGTG